MNRSDASAINYQNGKKVNLSKATNLYTPNNQNNGVQKYNDKALLGIDFVESNPLKKVKQLRTIGWIGGGTLLATGITILVVYNNKLVDFTYETNTVGIIGGIACIGAGVGLTTFCLIKANKIEKQMNQLQSFSIYQYDFKLSNSSSLSSSIDLLTDRTTGSKSIGLGLRYNF